MNQTRRSVFPNILWTIAVTQFLLLTILSVWTPCASAQSSARSTEYDALQKRLAKGWNTWDVHSVTTHVLLPEGLAIHIGMKHNTTLNGDGFLSDALIGRLDKDAEVVTPGPHSWDGSYTRADLEWKGHKWRIQSAHDGGDLVI